MLAPSAAWLPQSRESMGAMLLFFAMNQKHAFVDARFLIYSNPTGFVKRGEIFLGG
jgi:hypothetical protein